VAGKSQRQLTDIEDSPPSISTAFPCIPRGAPYLLSQILDNGLAAPIPHATLTASLQRNLEANTCGQSEVTCQRIISFLGLQSTSRNCSPPNKIAAAVSPTCLHHGFRPAFKIVHHALAPSKPFKATPKLACGAAQIVI
jgi:hypothetical protein